MKFQIRINDVSESQGVFDVFDIFESDIAVIEKNFPEKKIYLKLLLRFIRVNSYKKIRFDIAKSNHERFWKLDVMSEEKLSVASINSFPQKTYKIIIHSICFSLLQAFKFSH